MNIVLKLILFIVSLLLLLVSIAIVRTVLLPEESFPQTCVPDDEDYISNGRGLSKRLSEAIQFQTVSTKHHTYNEEALLNFGKFIKKSFPNIHSSPLVTREVVNNLSLLYHIKGSDASLKPYLLAAHLDVVPVDPAGWEVPPFGGQIKDGFIWGRGAIDCKHLVMGTLEALEFLLSKGFKPKRSFYLAFGHDEEVSGLDGARHISNLLKSRNVVLEYILDEGVFVLDNVIPFIKGPIAFIGVSEKGALDIKLKVQGYAGHSSAPPKENAIVILSKALAKLEGDVFPSMFGRGPEKKMLEELACCVPFHVKVVLGNMWLFRPVIRLFMKSSLMKALVRTTTAITLVSGGTKINVLPSSASASANLRVHPAQTISEALDYLKSVINDERVKIEVITQMPPHPVSPIDSFGYLTIKKSVRQIYNDSCVVPTTLIANTDTRWYLGLSESIYRFSLVRMDPSDVKRFHGDNERISVSNYVDLVNFMVHLMKNSDASHFPAKHTHEDL